MEKNNIIEIWKDIPQYKGIYQVSNLGNVKSLKRITVTEKRSFPLREKILSKLKNKDGYLYAGLCVNGKRKGVAIHQLVAMAFLAHSRNGYEKVVDHINNDRKDNRVENLRIITARENTSEKKINTSSKYVGVYWCNTNKKWIAHIRVLKDRLKLGHFNCELSASVFYDKALKSIEKNEEIILKRYKKNVKYNNHLTVYV
jgi:hypothetical protein